MWRAPIALLFVLLVGCGLPGTTTEPPLTDRELVYSLEGTAAGVADELVLLRQRGVFGDQEWRDVKTAMATLSDTLEVAHAALEAGEPVDAIILTARALLHELIAIQRRKELEHAGD